MTHSRLIAPFFSLLLLMGACTFTMDEPSGITREITPITPKGSISLKDYIDTDTIYLYTDKTFTFDIRNDLGGSQFAGEAYFDNKLFYEFNSRQGQFNIPDSYLKTGTHKLKLSFNESLNDQSLITRFKELRTTIFREWIVIVDIDPPPVFKITTAVENGYLKYIWPAYKKTDFINYELAVRSGSNFQRLTINDPSRNFFIDSIYVDGMRDAYISVIVHAVNGSADADKGVNEPAIKLNMVFHPEDTTAVFVWNKPKYRGAFKAYTISDNGATLANVTTFTDTTLVLKVDGAFPNVTRLDFKMLDKSGVEIVNEQNSIDFFKGNAMPSETISALFWYYSKTANKFIARSGPAISIYDETFNLLTSRTIEGNEFYGVSVAWPGDFMHYIGSGYTISQLNLVTNSEIAIPVYGDFSRAYLSAVYGTSNQVVSYYAFENDQVHPWKSFTGLADMQIGSVLHQEESNGIITISDDGRYSVGWPKVYSVSGGTQTYIGTIPDNYHFRLFRGDNTDEIITTQNDASGKRELKTIIVRSSDMAILRTFDIPEPGFLLSSYDPSTKTLLYTKHGATKVYLVNIETGSKKIFKASGSYNTPLVNGMIIIGSRYIKAL